MAIAELHPLRILRRSSKLSASLVVGFALTLVVNLAIGRYLTPEQVGVLAVIGVWTFYASLLRPGLLAMAGRDMPHLLGEGKIEEAQHIQNVALTGELVFSLVPPVFVFIAGCLSGPTILRWGLWVAALASFIVSFQNTLTSMFNVYQRFDLAARQRFILSVIAPAAILLTITRLGIFSPVAMPAVASLVGLVFVFRHREVIGYRPAWSSPTARYMLRGGIPFTLMTFVSWAYFMSDRPALIAAGVPLAVLGYYSFASNLIRSIAQIFWDFTSVLQPMLWHEIGRQGFVAAVASDVTRVWIPYTAVACFVTSAAQAGFGAVVRSVTPRFAPSIALFEILVFILVFYNATQLPNLVLMSRAINRQDVTLYLWSGGLILNVAVLFLCARAGASITVIAATSMFVDLLIAIAGYALIHQHLFTSMQAGLSFYAWQAALMAVSVGVYFSFQADHLLYTPTAQWLPLIYRGTIVMLVWGCVGLAMWYWWRRVAQTSKGRSPALEQKTLSASGECGEI